MRRALCVLILAMLAAMLPGGAVWADGIAIDLNGKAIETNGDTGIPFMDPAGRVMVPLRVVAEQAGALVAYDAANRLARVSAGDQVVLVPIDRGFVVVNGVNKPNDAPAQIRNGRTYLPIRIVMEALGYTVNWDAASTRVLISGPSGASGTASPEESAPVVPAVNKAGNSSINLYNGGLISREGNWLYFVNFSDDERLWRVDVTTGKANAVSKGKARSVNVVNGWVTYRQQYGSGTWEIHRTSGDGERDEVISTYDTKWLRVEGGDLYFYQSEPLYFYARTEKDPRNLQKIPEPMAGISMENGRVTYTEMEENPDGTEYPGNIVQRNWDGTGFRVISDERTGYEEGLAVIINGDLLYSRYLNSQQLYRLPAGKSASFRLTEQPVVSLTGDGTAYFGIFKGRINGLHRIAMDGSGITALGPSWTPRYDYDPALHLVGSYLYYLEEDGRSWSWVRVHRDTGEVTRIGAPTDFVEP